MSAFPDFTVIFLLRVGPTWPPPERVTLFDSPIEGGRVEVSVAPDGHLEVAVGDDVRQAELLASFQRIEVREQADLVLAARCGSNVLRLDVNGSSLRRLDESEGEPLVLAASETPLTRPTAQSLQDDGAADACDAAVADRRQRFQALNGLQRKTPHRAKTDEEQRAELVAALKALEDLVAAVSRGAAHHLPSLASQLRGLIYSPNTSPTWNPLLYRLANQASAPLPVYAEPRREEEAAVLRRAVVRIRRITASLTARDQADKLMELIQEFVQMPMITIREDGQAVREVTVQDVLGVFANTMGSAHYDESIDLAIDRVGQTVACNRSLLQVILCELATVTVALGRRVLHDRAATT